MKTILTILGKALLVAVCASGFLRSVNAQPKAGNDADQSAKAIGERLEKQSRLNAAMAKKNEAMAKKADDVRIKVEAELNAAQSQTMAQLKPFMKVELAFVARVCRLDKEQRKLLAEQGEEILENVARQSGGEGRQLRGMAGGAVRVINGNIQMPADTRKLIEDRVAAMVVAKLSPEQAELYKTEQAERLKFRKRTTINNIVSLIDKKLMLTTSQRESICEALAEKWAGSSLTQVDISMYVDNYLPLVRDDCVVPCLYENQKAAWTTRQVANRAVVTGVNFAPGFEIDDNELDPE
jgi:hypothetical protein